MESDQGDDNSWLKLAHCRGSEPAIFFSDDTVRALLVCQKCIVQAECLADVLTLEDKLGHRNGVFGNTTAAWRSDRYGTPRISR